MPAARPDAIGQPPRVIGRIIGTNPGPTLICIASLHGNEPAGFQALQRVFQELATSEPVVRGQFVGLGGNLTALVAGHRYIDRDLNRHWSRERVTELRSMQPPGGASAEDRELLALLEEIERVIVGARSEVYVVDLHTTSGESPPFATIGDTLRNRRFALEFPVPVVLGLEEHIDGTLLEYLTTAGHITMGFEGGQHDDPASVDHIRAAVWTALAVSGILENGQRFAPVHLARSLLTAVSRDIPRVVEVRYRHAVEPGTGFRMRPGYATFQPVEAGEPLAMDAVGEYAAPEGGRILMPLYQPLGDDGFFLVREFRPFWLRVSAILRRMRLDALLHWLPGVTRHPALGDTFVVDQRVARYFALQIFHLLGYRRKRIDGTQLLVSRRRHDLPGT